MTSTLLSQVRAQLVRSESEVTTTSVATALNALGHILGASDVAHMTRELSSAIYGFGPLEPLIAQPGITDILVNSPTHVYVDGVNGIQPAEVAFDDEYEVRLFAQRLASLCERRLDDASPWVDGQLPNGIRVHAILPPISGGNTCISLRIPRPQHLSLSEIATQEQQDVLLTVLESDSFCISGATGSGKTTLLSGLLAQLPAHERIVILEDSKELHVPNEHAVSLSARPANADGVGAVHLRDLVRQSLRMRPDRIVVGEVRGDEVIDLMLALGSGHYGATTVHAHSAEHTITRLRTLLLVAGMSERAIDAQIASALGVIISVKREGGRRFIEGISRIHLTASGLRMSAV